MLKSPIVSGLPLSYIATSLCVSSLQVCVCVACVDACSLMAVVYPLLPSSPCMFGFPTGKARRGMWLGHEPSTPSCTPCCDVCRHKASRMLPSYSRDCWGDVGMTSASVRPMTSTVWVTSVQSRVRFCVIHALKFTMTPKTESRGSKMTPCHFCGNLKCLVPTSKTMIFLMILIIKSCKHLWYRPNTDPFIAFNFDLHLFCKIKCSALQAV